MQLRTVSIVVGVWASLASGLMADDARPTATPAAAADTLAALPIRPMPARGTGGLHGALTILLTGDGGWRAIDKQLADSLAAHGAGVVVLDSRAYFHARRDPDGTANDVARVATQYLAAWGDERLILVGYSRGADVLPFVASRLPPDLAGRVRLVALLGPARHANFKFHLVDLFADKRRADDLMTIPEIEKLRGAPVLCIFGADEKDTACRDVHSTLVTPIEMPGGHHFDEEYGIIAHRILQALDGE